MGRSASEALANREARHREAWQELGRESPVLADIVPDSLADPRAAPLLATIFRHSPFLSGCLLSEPDLPLGLFGQGPDAILDATLARFVREARPVVETAELMRLLRTTRRRVALLTALADLGGMWPLETVCGALSRLADLSLSVATAHLLRRAHEKGDLVLPFPEEPERDCAFFVLAMGKLGARELNYSSDIDLILLYDQDKVAYRGRRSAAELFVAMARELTRILSEPTGDGYVFRVDLRLRPDPGAMPLAISLEAAMSYYEELGQNWERAALIKARPVAGDQVAGAAFMGFLRHFIWRKHLDFAAIQDIHSIKRQIDAHRGGGRIAVAGHNIKLGRGGIREIEFFVQTQQLIRGGREPVLRDPRTLQTLSALERTGTIGRGVAAELGAAYVYLRTLEHRLQMIDDRQTQTLPGDGEKLEELALFMGHAGLGEFDFRLRQVLGLVEKHYARLFEDAPPLASGGNLVFTGADDDPGTIETLGRMGFRDPQRVCAAIRGWHHGRLRATRSARARELLTELVPSLLAALAEVGDADATFARFEAFLAALPAGVPLFSLFHANAGLIGLVAGIMGEAPRLAESLGRKPALLDAMLDRDFSAHPPGKRELARDLAATIADAGDSYERLLDAVRGWADDFRFRIGVLMLHAALPGEESARHLTHAGDAILAALTPRVEAEFATRHGRVAGRGMALIALGRMGGSEMTATSDLDLILVYDAPVEAMSDGPQKLPASLYYARLTQRLITALSARTAEGVLYEVDLRLRPSGTSGPIATSLAAFRLYHAREAWTWERMALTRARIVFGPPKLRAAIAATIRRALRTERDPETLRRDVADMRLRIADEHKPASPWDVKYRPGGLVDIDFIAQYLALRWAAEHAGLLARGTAPLLRHEARAGVLPAAEAAALLDALHLWTEIQQFLRHALPGEPNEDSMPATLRHALAQACGCRDFAELGRHCDATEASVRAIYDRIVAKATPRRGQDEEQRRETGK